MDLLALFLGPGRGEAFDDLLWAHAQKTLENLVVEHIEDRGRADSLTQSEYLGAVDLIVVLKGDPALYSIGKIQVAILKALHREIEITVFPAAMKDYPGIKTQAHQLKSELW
jgi:hypothetical protein